MVQSRWTRCLSLEVAGGGWLGQDRRLVAELLLDGATSPLAQHFMLINDHSHILHPAICRAPRVLHPALGLGSRQPRIARELGAAAYHRKRLLVQLVLQSFPDVRAALHFLLLRTLFLRHRLERLATLNLLVDSSAQTLSDLLLCATESEAEIVRGLHRLEGLLRGCVGDEAHTADVVD